MTIQLRELEIDGIIYRKIYPESPPRVEYGLTNIGKSIKPILSIMCEWGKDYKNLMSDFTIDIFKMEWVAMLKDTFLNLPEEKQQKIFKEAINEFSNKGYEKGNVSEIAKIAGVAKESMYQYFEDKKELFIYCIKKAFELFNLAVIVCFIYQRKL